jgi:YebC/PmpR family DNA-binding regulatory protein
MENIERAIKRALGKSEGAALLEATFEGYGPGGIAILLQTLTDNRNRTLTELRNTFARSGGSLGESGCVSWLFESKGVLTIKTDEVDAEDLALLAIDAGADDVNVGADCVEIYTKPEDLEKIKEALSQKVTISSAEISLVPKTTIKLDNKGAIQSLRLLERLEELDDVQSVFTNADFPNEVLQEYRG